MPGKSFLFKKKFHPARMSNQKRLFIAEQSVADRNKLDEERKLEMKKEIETKTYENMQLSNRNQDPRHNDLKFMYAQPKELKATSSSYTKPGENISTEPGDDEMVRKFKQRMENKFEVVNTNQSELSVNDDTNNQQLFDTYDDKFKMKNDPKFGASAHRSKLEDITGKKRKIGLSQQELSERFSFLKNAPMEGIFAKNIEIRHKPFNEIIRNVQCLRCGEWGHQSGDRECSLRDNNPHDLARQRREDPLTYMQSDAFLIEKQKMILRHAAAASGTGTEILTLNNKKYSSTNESIRPPITAIHAPVSLVYTDEEVESDPEKEFIATLSRREKKLLLRKLKQIEMGHTTTTITNTTIDSNNIRREGDDEYNKISHDDSTISSDSSGSSSSTSSSDDDDDDDDNSDSSSNDSNYKHRKNNKHKNKKHKKSHSHKKHKKESTRHHRK